MLKNKKNVFHRQNQYLQQISALFFVNTIHITYFWLRIISIKVELKLTQITLFTA